MSSQEVSVFSFDVRELVTLQPLKRPVKEIVNLELIPEVSVNAQFEHVSIRGFLIVKGEYLAEGEEREQDADGFQLTDYDTGEEKKTAGANEEEVLLPIDYQIPLEISVAAYRVPRLDEVQAEVQSLDFELKQENQLELSAELAVYGIYQRDPSAQTEDARPTHTESESAQKIVAAPVSGTDTGVHTEGQETAPDESIAERAAEEVDDSLPGEDEQDREMPGSVEASGNVGETPDVEAASEVEAGEEVGVEEELGQAGEETGEAETFRVLATDPSGSSAAEGEESELPVAEESVPVDVAPADLEPADEPEGSKASNVIPLRAKVETEDERGVDPHDFPDGPVEASDAVPEGSDAVPEDTEAAGEDFQENRPESREGELEEPVFKVSISSKRHQEEERDLTGNSFANLLMKPQQPLFKQEEQPLPEQELPEQPLPKQEESRSSEQEEQPSGLLETNSLSGFLSPHLAGREEKTVSIRLRRFQTENSLSGLAETYGVDLQDLLRANRLSDGPQLKEGDLLWIPVRKRAQRR